MKKIILYIGLVIISSAFGYVIWEIFTRASFYQLQIENINFVTQRMTTQFFLNMIFAFSIGIIPILYLMVNKIAKLKTLIQRLQTVGIIVLSGLSMWQIRIIQLNNQFDFNSKFSTDHFGTAFNTDGLKFEIYLLIGLIIGSLISLIIFRSINSKK